MNAVPRQDELVWECTLPGGYRACAVATSARGVNELRLLNRKNEVVLTTEVRSSDSDQTLRLTAHSLLDQQEGVR